MKCRGGLWSPWWSQKPSGDNNHGLKVYICLPCYFGLHHTFSHFFSPSGSFLNIKLFHLFHSTSTVFSPSDFLSFSSFLTSSTLFSSLAPHGSVTDESLSFWRYNSALWDSHVFALLTRSEDRCHSRVCTPRKVWRWSQVAGRWT